MHYQTFLLLFCSIFAVTFYKASTQKFSLGGCKHHQGVDYIDYEKINGTWYEYSRSPRLVEDFARCVTFVWSVPKQGMEEVKRYQINDFLFVETQSSSEQNISITGAGRGKTHDHFNYTILAVDYDNYMTIYSCQDYKKVAKSDIKFILTRDRKPSDEVIEQAKKPFSDYKIKTKNMKKTNQTGCPDTWESGSGLLGSTVPMRG